MRIHLTINVVDLENHQWIVFSFFFWETPIHKKHAIFFLMGKIHDGFRSIFAEIDPFFIGRHQRCSKCGAA